MYFFKEGLLLWFGFMTFDSSLIFFDKEEPVGSGGMMS